MSDTPETEGILTSRDNSITKLVDFARKLERQRDELRAKLQYVTGQLIEAGCDCGAAPVEELARRAKKDIAELRQRVANLEYSNEQHRLQAESWRAAAAERDELREQLAEVKRLVSSEECFGALVEALWNKPEEELIAERDELRDEVERLKADKVRLDWLLKQGLCFRDANKFDPNWRVGNETEWLYEIHDARATIDAAMKGAE